MGMAPAGNKRQGIDILFLSHVDYLLGGAEKSLFELIKDSKRQKLKVHVLIPGKGDFYKALKKEGVDCTIISPNWWIEPFRKQEETSSAYSTIEAVSAIRSLNPRLCVSNTITSPSLGLAASVSNKPHIWIIREYGEKDHGINFRLGTESTYKLVSALSNEIFCNSKSLSQYYSDKMHRETKIIYPYVHKPSYTKVDTPFSTGKEIKLSIVGSIQYGRGQLDAIKTIEKINKAGKISATLDIIGGIASKNYYDEINAYVEKKNLTRYISFKGHLKNPYSQMVTYDAILVCSKNEAFGRVAIEAMYMQIPVIGADSGGTAEIIENGKNGLLFQQGNITDIVTQVTSLALNPNLVSTIQKNGLAYANQYSIDYSHKDFFASAKKYLKNSTAISTFALTPFGDVISLFEDKEKWWKNDEKNMKSELTKSHHIITNLQKENDNLRQRSVIQLLKRLKGN